ncbi:MAG: histidinol-phosphate transaminase [Firmicutes bacterium]|nr:histidinol-phosphate transaminase [Bacillota bacterium]
MHVNTTLRQDEIRHVYLREARSLRPDLPEVSFGATSAGTADRRRAPVPRPATACIEPYVPGKSAEEARQELGLASVIKLASNENPLGPSPHALKALAGCLHELHRYPDGRAAALRKALSEKYGLPADHFLVANGSDGILKLLAEAYLEPGDEVVVGQPSFSQYSFAARLMGAREVVVPLVDMRHDLPAMAAAIGPRTKIVFLCNPHNPTGTVVSRDEVERFLEQVPPHVLVVLDEAYAEYVEDPGAANGMAWVEQSDRSVVVVRTFSKIYGLAGLRVGYAAASPNIIETLSRVQEPFQVNALAQVAAAAALRDQEHVERSRRINQEGKQYFYRRLRELGLEYVPTEANFVLIDTGQDSRDVFEQLLRRGVIVRPGAPFGLTRHVRVTIGTEEQNQRFFAALEEVLGCREPDRALGRPGVAG